MLILIWGTRSSGPGFFTSLCSMVEGRQDDGKWNASFPFHRPSVNGGQIFILDKSPPWQRFHSSPPSIDNRPEN